MSLYNLMNGINPAAIFILPMLGHHPDWYGRFRDCFVDDGMIHVYTRLGGGNREDYEDIIKKIRAHPDFVTDRDDDFDCTYATFIFNVPKQWQADFDLIMVGKLTDISTLYQAELDRAHPKLKKYFHALV